MAGSARPNTHLLCIKCKLSSTNENSICCTQCFNWFHSSCSGLSKVELRKIKHSNLKFKCTLCLNKSNCHFSLRKYNPRSLRVNCLNCENSFCSKCAALSGSNIRSFLTPDKSFYCNNCDETYACLKCKKPCEELPDSDPSIFCECCKRWIHFNCSQLTVRQFNKLGRTSEPYFCHDCIWQNLPFSKVSKKSFFDKQMTTEHSLIEQSKRDSCKLCIECSGSVGAFVKDSLDVTLRKDLDITVPGVFETVWFDVRNNKNKKCTMGIIYRHPGLSEISFFERKLEMSLSKLRAKNSNVYIFGDFNINSMKYDEVPIIKSFIDMMHSYSLVNLINRPTRFPRGEQIGAPSLIDHFYTNKINTASNIGLLVSDISDHFPIIATLNIDPRTTKNRKLNPYIRDFRNFNSEEFNESLSRFTYSESHELDICF